MKIVTLVGILLLASVLVATCGCTSSNNAPSQYSTSVPIQEQPQAQAMVSVTINSIQQANQLSQTLGSAATPRPGTVFLVFNTTVKNLGVKNLYMGAHDYFELKSADNVTYETSLSMVWLPNALFNGDYTGANQKLTGLVVFEIDRGAKPAQFIYDDTSGVFSQGRGGRVVIDLVNATIV